MDTRMKGIVLVLVACLLLTGLATPAFAASASWNGTNDGNWADPNNWSTLTTVPTVVDTATFNNAGNANTTVNLGTGASVGGIVFDTASAAAYTIGAGGLNAQSLIVGTSGVTMTNTVTQSQTVNALILLGTGATAGTYSFTNNSASSNLYLAGIQSNTGGTAAAKTVIFGGTGAGRIQVNGSILGSGGMTLTNNFAGTLAIYGTSTVTTLNMNGGANSVLDLGASNLVLNNGGAAALQSSTGGIINGSGGGAITLSGTITAAGDNNVAAGKTLIVNARLTGNATFEMYGNTGTFVFNNPLNDYVGDTLFNAAGTIQAVSIGNVGAASALGMGTNINFNSAGAKLIYVGTGGTTNRNILLNQNATIDQSGPGGWLKFAGLVNNAASARTLTLQGSTPGVGEIAGIISDNSTTNTTSITKTGTGIWVLSGSNSYSGPTTVSAGKLVLANPLAVQNSTLTYAGGAVIFDANAYTSTLTLGGLAGSANLVLANNAATPAALSLSVGKNNSTTVFSGTIVGSGSSLTKVGSGVLSIGGTSAYTGGTTVTAGGLVYLNTAAMPALGATTVAAGAYIGLGMGGAGGFTTADLDSLYAGTYPTISVTPTTGIILDSTQGAFTWGSTLAGSRNLIKVGTNVATLSGNNAYTGNTVVAGGTLALSGYGTGLTGTMMVYGTGNGTLQLQANAGNTNSGVATLINPGTGKLGMTNGSTLQLRSDSNVVFGGGDGLTNINGVTVTFDVNQLTSAGSARTLTFAPAGIPIGNAVTLNVTGGNGYALALGNITNVTGTTTLTLSPSTGNLNLAGYTQNIATGSTLILGGTGSVNTIGFIAGTAVTVTKNGTSTWYLSGTNNYVSGTNITQGILNVTGEQALGAASGAILFNGTSAVQSVLQNGSASLTLNAGRPITTNAGAIGSFDTNGGTITVSGKIVGSGAIGKMGTGLLYLASTNSYLGGTYVYQGSVQMGANNSLSTGTAYLYSATSLDLNGMTASNVIKPVGTGNVIFNSSATPATVIGQISGSGYAIIGVGTGFSGDITINDVKSDVGSNFYLYKVGTGKLTIAGSGAVDNAYLQLYVNGGIVDVTKASNGTARVTSNMYIGTGAVVLVDNTIGSLTAGTLGMNGGTLDLLGNNLTFGNTVGNSLAGTAGTILNSKAVTTSTIVYNTSAGSTFGGNIIDGTGIIALTKGGSGGTLALTGTNTYSGGTTISLGAININSDAAIGCATGTILFTGTGTATLQAGASNITLNSSRIITVNAGQVANIDTNGYTNMTITGNIVGSGGLRKTGTSLGNLILTGNNSFLGDVTVYDGGLTIIDNTGLGAGNKTVYINRNTNYNPTLYLVGTGASPITLGSNISWTTSNNVNQGTIVSVAGNNVINGNFSMIGGGGGTRITVGDGTLTLTGVYSPGATSRSLELYGTGVGYFNGLLVAGSGGTYFVKGGPGTWYITGTNTNDNGAQLAGGTLNILFDQNLGASSGPITFTGNSTLQAGADAINLPASRTITVNTGVTGTIDTQGYNMLVNGSVVGPGTLTKIGTGTLTLAGSNDNTSLTMVINAGTVDVLKSTGTSAARAFSNVTVNSGGTLRNVGTGGMDMWWTTLTMNGGTFDLYGHDMNIVGNGNLAGTGATAGVITNNGTGLATFTLTKASNSIFGGTITDGSAPLAISKQGSGTLTLTGTNTFTGGLTIGGGATVNFNGEQALGPNTGAITFNNGAGTLQMTSNDTSIGASRTLTVATGVNAQFDVGANSTLSFDGSIVTDATGAVTKTGAGILRLTGSNNAWTIPTNVSAGVLTLANVAARPAGSVITVPSATIALGVGSGPDYFTSTDLDALFTNTFSGVVVGTAATIGIDTSAGDFTYATSRTSTLSLNKLGPNTLSLTGSNTFKTLYFTGTGTTGSAIDIGSGSLYLNNSGSQTILANASGVINGSGGGVIVLSTNGTNYADNAVSAGQTLVINAQISSAGGFELYGATGTFVFNNPLNNYAGDTLFNAAGTIVVPMISNIGQAGSLGAGTNINFNSAGAKLVYVGTGDTTNRNILLNANAIIDQSGTGGTLKFTSNVGNGASARTLTLQGSTPGVGEIAGVISDNSATNTTSIYKTGSGMWTLSGNNTYSGSTTVNGGILNLAKSLALQNSTLILGGTSGVGALSFDASVASNAFTIGGLSASTGATLSLVNAASAPVALAVGMNGANVTFLGGLAGPGSLTKIGTGIQTLAGTNSYTGGTTISAGTLNFQNTAALTGSVTVAAGAIMGLGVGTSPAYFTSTDIDNLWANTMPNVTMAANSGVAIDTTAGNFTYGSSLTGIRGLTKVGANTLVLTGNNDYTGGTYISGGILQVGTGGATGSITGNVVNNGSLVINSATPVITLGAITGSGTFTKQGTGAVILAANNTYSGGTTLSDGSLALGNQYALRNTSLTVGAGKLVFDANVTANAFTLGGLAGTGAITLQNNASGPIALTVGANNLSTTYAGNLNGAGSLTKIGSGTLTLQGSNSYTGATNIAALSVIAPGTANYPSTAVTISGTAGAILGSTAINIGNGTLTLDNAAGKNTNRIADTATVTTNGSSFMGYTVGTSSQSYSETIGTLNVNSGYFQYTGGQTGTGQSSVFTIGTLTHGANSIVNFSGTLLGGTGAGDNRNKVVINNGVTAGADIGPWAVVNGADFAYYDATQGVIAGTSSELISGGAGTGGANYKLTTGNLTLTGSTSYKTFLMNSGTSRTLTATNMTLNVGGISFAGQNQNITGGTIKALATGTPLYINMGGAYTNTVSSNIVDNGNTALVVGGVGNSSVLYLTGTNTFNGGLYLSNAVLETAMDAALGAASSPVYITGNSRLWGAGTAVMSAARTFNINNNSLLVIDLQSKGAWTINGQVTGNGGISTGYGNLILANTNNNFTGPIGIGTYNTGPGNCTATFASVADSVAGVPNCNIVLGSNAYSGTFIYTGASNVTFDNRGVDLANTTAGGVIQNDGAGALVFNGGFTASGAGSKTLTLQGASTGNNAFNSLIVDNSLINKTNVTKAGTGAWVLGGTANTFTGTLTIAQGTLIVPQLKDNATAVTGGNGVGNIVFGVAGSNTDSVLRYTGTGDYTFSNRKIALVGNGGSATIDFTGGANILLDANNIVQNQVGTKTLILSSIGTGNGIITPLADGGSGSLGLGVAGTGSVWNLDAANTYTGATNVGPLATLKLNNVNAIAANNVGTLTVNGTLDLSAQTSLTVGALAGTGLIDNITGAAVPYTLTFGNGNTSGTYSGTIQNTVGVLNLVKVGSGLQVLAGSNAWTGTTTISGGVLRAVIPAGNLVINGGALEGSSFTRLIGTGDNQVQFTGNGGGFSSYGGAVNLDFSGTGIGAEHLMTWGTSGNAMNLGSGQFILNGPAANNVTTFSNSLALNDSASPVTRAINVGANSAYITGALSDGTVNSDGFTPAGAAGLIKTGTGTLYLAGTLPNTYTGDTFITGAGGIGGSTIVLAKPDGVIALPSSNIYLGSTSVTGDAHLRLGANNQTNPGAILYFTGGTNNAKFELNGYTTTIAGFVIGSGSTKAIIQNLETGSTGIGTLVIKSDTFDSTFVGGGLFRDQSGKLAVTKDGNSTLTLGGANVTFSGGLNIQNGTVMVTQTTAFPSVVNFPAGSNGVLLVNGTGNTVGSLNTDPAFNSAIVQNVAGISGTLNLTALTGYYTFNGVLQDNPGSLNTFSLFKSGTGTSVLVLGGTASNTYSGNTNLYGGTTILAKEGGATAIPYGGFGFVYLGNNTNVAVLQLGGTSGFATPTYNNQIDPNVTLFFTGGTGKQPYFKLMGNNQTLAGINESSMYGVIEVTENEPNAVSSTLTINANVDTPLTFNGYMRDHGTGGSGILQIAKGGTGRLILTGSNITYTGNTTVHDGVFTLNNAPNAVSTIVFDANSTGVVEIAGVGGIGGLIVDPSATSPFIQNVGTGNTTLIINPQGTGVFNGLAMRDNPDGFTLSVTKLGTGTAVLTGTSGTPMAYNGTTTVSAGTLILDSGITLNPSARIVVSGNGTMDLNGNTQISTGIFSVQGTGNLVNGTIYKSGTAYDMQGGTVTAVLDGDAGFTKSTTGVLLLTGTQSNVYTGPTVIAGGTTVLKKTGGAYAIPGNSLTIQATGADVFLNVGSVTEQGLYSNQFDPNMVINWSYNPSTGAFGRLNLYGNNVTVGGLETGTAGNGGLVQDLSSDGTGVTGVMNVATLTINNSSDHYFRGIMRNVYNGTGVLAVVKTGAGTQTLAGTYITFTGGLTINEGTIALQETTAFNSAITNNSHLQLTAPGPNWALPAAVVISGTGDLTKTGTGTTTISGSNTFGGGTTILAGTLAVGGNVMLGSASPLGASSSPIILGDANGSSSASLALNGIYVMNRDIHVQPVPMGNTLSIGGSQSIGSAVFGGNVLMNNDLTLFSTSANTTTAFTGEISGTVGNITIAGAGLVLLGGTNSYAGYTTVNSGAGLQFASSASIPANGILLASGNSLLAAAGPAGYTTAGQWLASGKIDPNSAGILALTASESSALNMTSTPGLFLGAMSGVTYSGSFTPGVNGYLLGGGAGKLTVSSLLSDNGGATPVIINGNVLLTNAGNSYTGNTVVNGGSTLGFNAGALGGTGSVVMGATLGTSTLQWSGANSTDLSGRLVFTDGSTVVMDTNGNDVTFTNPIGSGVGANLTKIGSGTLTLAGESTYYGTTTVQCGSLVANLRSGNPFGYGPILLSGGTLGFAPATTSDASPSIGDMTFTSGTVKLTVGSAASLTANANTLTRGSRGSLVILPTALSNLGASEKFMLGSNLGNVNGIYSVPGIFAQDSATNTGTFVKYDQLGTLGFLPAESTLGGNTSSYTVYAAGTGTIAANSIADMLFTGGTSYSTTTAGGVSPYALRIGAGTYSMPGTNNITTVGSNMIIMNPSATVQSVITGTGNSLRGGSTGDMVIYVGGGAAGAKINNNVIAGGNLVKDGPGTLDLNSYININSLTINGGIVTNNNTGGDNTKINTITINNGGTFKYASQNSVINTVIYTVNQGGTLDATAYGDAIGAIQGAGAVILGGSVLTTTSNSTYIFSGTLTGTGNGGILAYQGTLKLTGNSPAMYGTLTAGGTGPSMIQLASPTGAPAPNAKYAATFNGSVIQAITDNQFSSNNTVNLSASGAVLDISATTQTLESVSGAAGSQLRLGYNGSLTMGGNNTSSTFAGNISGVADVLNKNGTGTLTLSGTNTLSGTVNINGGTIGFTTLANTFGTATVYLNGGGLTWAGTANTSDISGNIGTQVVTSGTPLILDTNGNNPVFANGIADSNFTAFVKNGAGTLTLSGTNTYTVGTNINGGILQFGIVPASGMITINSNGTLAATGQAGFSNASEWLASGRIVGTSSGTIAIMADSNSDISMAGYPNLYLGTLGNNTYSGTITPDGTGSYLLGGGTGTMTITSDLALSVPAYFRGSVLFLGGVNDVTSIVVGTSARLQIGNGGTIGTLGTGTVTVNTGGTLALDRSDVITVNNSMVNNGTVTVMKGMVNFTGLITGTNPSIFSANGTLTDLPVINIQAGANITGRFIGGNGAAFGMINQSGGTTNLVGQSTMDNWFGNGAGNYGFYNLTGGTMNNNAYLNFGANGAVGVFYQSGGTMTMSGGWIGIGYGASGMGVANFTGGVTNFGTGNSRLQILGYNSSGGNAQVNINGGYVVTPGGNVQFDNGGGNTGSGYLTLKAGTLETSNITRVGTGAGYVNFNGATLRINAGGTGATMTGLNGAYVYSGGANIDTNGQAFIIAQPLLTPAGTAGIASISASNVSGYVGVPFVLISDGTGTGNGATAVANVDANGVFDGTITVTSPGYNYVNPTVTLIGGGGTGSASASLGTETSGGLNKIGSGTLVLTGANTYTGDTKVNDGLLIIGNTNALAKSILDVSYNGTASFGTGVTSATVAGLKGSQPISLTNASGTGTTLTIAGTGSGYVYSGGLSGAGGLYVNLSNTGTGPTNTSTFALTGTNSFTGGVTVNQGQVQITNSASLGAGTKTIQMTNGSAGNPTLALIGTGGNIILPSNMSFTTSNGGFAGTIFNLAGDNVINGNFSMTSGGGGTMLTTVGGTLTMNGIFTPIATGRALQLAGSGVGTVNGLIQDGTSATAFYVQKSGPGTWTLTATNNYSLRTEIAGGNLAILFDQNLGQTAAGVTFTGNGALQAGASGIVLNSSRVITVNPGFAGTVDTQGYNMTITGRIAGTGNFVKAGSGTLYLTGSSDIVGGMSIANGTLNVNSDAALGAVTGGLAFTGNGTLQAGATGITIGGGRTITLNTGVTGTVDTQNDDTTIASKIVGAGNLVKTGTGLLTLSGSNSFSGTTTISNNTLALTNSAALSGSVLNFNNGDGELSFTNLTAAAVGGLSGNKNLTLLNTGGVGVNLIFNSGNATYSGVLSGTGASITKTGTGTQILTGVSTYTGGTYLTGGTLTLSGGNDRLPVGTTLTLGGTSGGTLDIGANSQSIYTLAVASTGAIGNIVGAGGTLTLTGATDLRLGPQGTSFIATVVNMSGLSNFVYNAPGNQVRVGDVSGNLQMNGSSMVSTVFLANNNAITALNLNIGDNSGSGGGGLNILHLGQTNTLHVANVNMGFSGRSSSILNFAAGLTDPTVTIRNTDGTSAVTNWNIGSVNTYSGASRTWSNTADFSGGYIDALVGSMVIGLGNPTAGQTGRVGTEYALFRMGSGNLTVNGSGVVLGRLSNTGTGNDFNINGTMEINGGNAAITNILLADTTSTIAGGTANGTLTLNGGSLKAGVISMGSGVDTLGATINWTNGVIGNYNSATDLTIGSGINITMDANGTHTLNVDASRWATIASAISGVGASLSKTGSGTLYLTNTNTYTGATTVNGGVLRVNGALASSVVNVNSGATLGGNGSLGGDLNVNAGGILAPGNSIGTINVAGNTTLDANSTSDFEFGTPGTRLSPGTSDRTNVSGSLTMGGTLNLIDNAGANGNGSMGAGSYKIFTYGGTGTGTFTTVNQANPYHSVVVNSPADNAVFVDVYRLAESNVVPTTLTFGNSHVGDAMSQYITLTNAAANDGYSEKLDASLTGTGHISTSGTVSLLAAGSSDSNTLKVSVDTSTAGHKSGTVTVQSNSNGSGTSGFGTTALANQTISVNGGDVYRFAEANVAPTTLHFANYHVGDLVADQAITLSNTAANDGYSEKLNGSLSATGGIITSGTVSLLAAGASDGNSLKVRVDTSSVGSKAGTVMVGLVSDGAGTSGLGQTSLTGQSVTVTGGDVYRLAEANYLPTTMSFGNHHVGETVSDMFITLSNIAANDGYSEKLNGTITATGGVLASGSVSLLAAGSSDGNSLKVKLDSNTPGSQAGTVTLHLTSDGLGTSGLGTTALADRTVAITSGSVYRYAEANVAPTTLHFANYHVGDSVTQQSITLANTAVNDGYSESLNGSLSATGGIITSGTVSLLAAGASDGNSLNVSISTTTAGSRAGTVYVGLVSDGAGTSGLGQTTLTTQTVNVTGGEVYRLASAGVTPSTLHFANYHVGDSVTQQAITLTNTAANDGYSEKLNGSLTATGGILTSGTVSLLVPGGTSDSLKVGISTAIAGSKAGTVTVKLVSDGTGTSGLGTTDLADQTVNVTGGGVYNYASADTIASPGNLGTVIRGATLTTTLSVKNGAPAGSYTEGLNAAFNSSDSNLVHTGSVSNLSGGSTDSTSLTTGVNTSTPGYKSGTVQVTLASSGTNSGLTDTALTPQDINVSGTVLDHSKGSFSSTLDSNSVSEDFNAIFGRINITTPTRTVAIPLYNLNVTPGYTAGLRWVSTDANYVDAPFTLDANDRAAMQNIAAGSYGTLHVSLSTDTAGTFSGYFVLTLGDQSDIAGHTEDQIVQINVTGTVTVPEPATMGLLVAGGIGLLTRRRLRI